MLFHTLFSLSHLLPLLSPLTSSQSSQSLFDSSLIRKLSKRISPPIFNLLHLSQQFSFKLLTDNSLLFSPFLASFTLSQYLFLFFSHLYFHSLFFIFLVSCIFLLTTSFILLQSYRSLSLPVFLHTKTYPLYISTLS